MTAILDFAMLPPEVNSARMYSGSGSGPMLAAASAWKGMAAELRSTALSYGTVLSGLTDEEWQGPASASMAAAAAPYVAWMETTAVQAEQTAAQAEAAAAAYEAAFKATVPPALIAANRTQLMSLLARNILGQNTAPIAATEAQYAEMWAQDAAAMYGYAGSSAVATQLAPFAAPQQITSASALTAQSAAATQAAATSAGTAQSTLSQLISSVPSALRGLATPAAPGSGLGGILDNLGLAIFSPGFYMPGNFLGTAADFMGQAAQSAGQAAGDAANGAANAAEGSLSELGAGLGNSVSAGLGHGALVGPLTVPPSWTGAAPQ